MAKILFVTCDPRDGVVPPGHIAVAFTDEEYALLVKITNRMGETCASEAEHCPAGATRNRLLADAKLTRKLAKQLEEGL
jgi:hypothetical protein